MSISTTGTGSVTLNAAVAGYRTFAASGIVDTDQIRYIIEDGSEFEIGIGLMSSSATVMARTVEESSNSNAALNLTSAAKVLIGITAGDLEANPAPRWTTEPASTLTLDNDGSTAVTLTGVAIDENFPVRYSWDGYIGSTIYDADSLPPQLASAPTINQSTGVTSLVGSSTSSNAGTYHHRSRATDGINTLSSTTAISLNFFVNSAHTKAAPHPESTSVYLGWDTFVGDTYYGATAIHINGSGGSPTTCGGCYAFNISDNTAVTGFNPMYIPNAAQDEGAGYQLGYSSGKEIAFGAAGRGLGVAYLYTLPSTTPTQLMPNGWSGTGSTTFAVAKETGSGVITHTYSGHGSRFGMSPNGNYVAIGSYAACQVQIFAGKAFGAYSKGDHVRTIQLTNNQYSTTGGQYGISHVVCNDTHVMTSQGYYHGNANEADVGRMRLYNISTGAEVTDGIWPYVGAANSRTGAYQTDITNSYAVFSAKNGNDPMYVLVDLSDNTLTTKTWSYVDHTNESLVSTEIFKDEYIITGQTYAETNGQYSGTVRAWNISDGSEKTDGYFPAHGITASEWFGTSLASSPTAIVASARGSKNGGSVANQGSIRIIS